MVEPWVGGGEGISPPPPPPPPPGISKVAERLKRLRKGLGWEEME